MPLLLGCGVVATAILRDSKGFGGGWLSSTSGGASASTWASTSPSRLGAHLNPRRDGCPSDGGQHHRQVSAFFYFPRRVAGAFLGAVARLARLQAALRLEEDAGAKLAVFSTGPAIRSIGVEPRHRGHRHLRAGLRHPHLRRHALPGRPAVRRAAGGRDRQPLGGPTGYAINPARDLGPRIAHALLPIKGKGAVDWALLLGPGRRPARRRRHRRPRWPRPSAPDPDRRSQGRGAVTRRTPVVPEFRTTDAGEHQMSDTTSPRSTRAPRSTRCMVFDHAGRVVAVDQMEHRQIFPRAGWVEHDADRDLGQHPRGRRPARWPGRT